MKNGKQQSSQLRYKAEPSSVLSLKSLSTRLTQDMYSIILVLSVLFLAFNAQNSLAADKSKDARKRAAIELKISKVNINKANANDIAAVLKGVGKKKAEAIVSWRKKHGRFKSIDQLAEVKGIGEATIDKNRAKISL